MTFLKELASFVVDAKASDLPTLDRNILRRHCCDVVVTRLAGGRTSEGGELQQVFPGATLVESIAVSAGLVRLTEMDDIHIASTTTPSSVSVPVALGLAAGTSCDPAIIESAVYVATELVVRFGKAMDGSHALLKGIWPTRAAASLGACAAACRVWGLGEKPTQEALGLAITMSTGKTGPFVRAPSGRWVLFANAVETGLRAAMAGRAGYSSGSIPPTEEWIATALGTSFVGSAMTAKLGSGSIYPELSLKPYATSRQTLSAAEAMLALVADGLDPRTVRKITIRVPKAHVALVSPLPDSKIRSRNFMSAALQVSIAALNPAGLFDAEREMFVKDSELLAYSQLCHVVGDDTLDSVFPETWGASLDLETAAGAVSRTVMEPLGSPQNRMDDTQLACKAKAVLAACGQADRADKIMALGRSVFLDPGSAEELGKILLGK